MADGKPTSLMAWVKFVENTLGCRLPEGSDPDWKKRMSEVAKIKARGRKDARLSDLRNLLIATEYCKRKRIMVKTPVGVTYHVEDALKVATEEGYDPVEDDIQQAIARERTLDDLFSESWMERLMRARGTARKGVLDEWRAAKR